jgi:hypothetical protein
MNRAVQRSNGLHTSRAGIWSHQLFSQQFNYARPTNPVRRLHFGRRRGDRQASPKAL